MFDLLKDKKFRQSLWEVLSNLLQLAFLILSMFHYIHGDFDKTAIALLLILILREK